jgi:DNA primase
MSRKGFSAETLEKAGLSIKGPRGFYDRFRDRIMFPITDARGKIIAFGGRILPEKDDGKQGKYINSPDSLVYNKSESLYGLSVTKGDIGRARSAVVVEGEFDLLSSWQSGVRGIVAIKGSALTVGQVNLIGRYADKLVMALDSDFAGQEAAVKGIEAAKNSGLDVVVARIPAEYKDPDEFASADPTGWTTAVRDATDVWSFMIDVLFAKYKGLTGSQKAKIGVEAAKILNRISDEIERIHYTKDVAERLAVPFEVLAKRLSTNSLSRAQEPHFAPVSLGEVAADRRTLLEERLIALAFSSEPKLLLERDLVQHIKTPLARRIVNFYEDYEPQGDWDVAEFARNLPEELYGGFAALVTLEEDDVSLANELHEVIHELHELVLKSQINELSKKIAESERDADESGLLEAQKEFAKVSVKLTEFEREIP